MPSPVEDKAFAYFVKEQGTIGLC